MPVSNHQPSPPTGYFYGPYIVKGVTRDDAPCQPATASSLQVDPDIVHHADEFFDFDDGNKHTAAVSHGTSLKRHTPHSWKGDDISHVGCHFGSTYYRRDADDDFQDMEEELSKLELEAKRSDKKKPTKNGEVGHKSGRQSQAGSGKKEGQRKPDLKKK